MEHLTLLLITAFLVKHFICDFTKLQTPWMFLNKGTYGHSGGIAHACVHIAASAPILLFFNPGDLHLVAAWGLLCVEGLVHYHMDWFKMWWGKRNDYKADTHTQFWFWLGIDQLVHGLTYVAMVFAWT